MYRDGGTGEVCADVFEHLRRDGVTVSYHLRGRRMSDGARWTHIYIYNIYMVDGCTYVCLRVRVGVRAFCHTYKRDDFYRISLSAV